MRDDEQFIEKLIMKEMPKSEEEQQLEVPKRQLSNPSLKQQNNDLNIIVDLHGFTRLGATQCIIRTFKSLDPTRSYKITFNVGVGNHSPKMNLF